MKLARRLKNNVVRWAFSRVLSNTLFTISLTGALSAYFTVKWTASPTLTHLPFIFVFLLGAFFLYHSLIQEDILYAADRQSLIGLDEWINLEDRVPSVWVTDSKSLFIQFMDIPLLNTFQLPESYILEFKAKPIHDGFSCCFNVDSDKRLGYMLQFNPLNKQIRPHFLNGLCKDGISNWTTPDTEGSPLRSIENSVLNPKAGFYAIRLEVSRKRYENYRLPAENDSRTTPEHLRTVIEVQVFDLNNHDQEICHLIFTNPLSKVYTGGSFGFRNYGSEAAIYKDIIVKAF